MNVLVIGSGTIGSTTAYTLSVLDQSVEVTLVDVNSDLAEGHAIDMTHSTRHASHPVGRPDYTADPIGDVRSADPDPALVEDADYIVVTASAPRSEDGAERGGRVAQLERNLEVADDVAEWVGNGPPTPTVVVTNPADHITYRFWQETGWPRDYILGYSLSESARIADELARRFDADPADVYCPILGEHGEHIVPVYSRATVDGESIDLTPSEREEISEYVRQVTYEVLNLRGPEQSSRWVTGRGIAAIVRRLQDGGVDTPICLSTPLDGEYGFEDVCMSVPVRLDASGVAEIVEWSLTQEERGGLEDAFQAMNDVYPAE